MFQIDSYTLLTVLITNLLAITGDVTITWTSPIIPKLQSDDPDVNPLKRPITNDEESWISSLINLGAIVGPFPYGLIAEKFGRKIGLLSAALPFIASFLILAFSSDVYLYYFARLLAGIAVGGSYALLPMYLAEISEDSNRGMLSVTLNVFWTLGNLLSYVIGPYVSIRWFNIILAGIPIIFCILFYLVAPESPYYLVNKNRVGEAERCLMKLRSQNEKAVESEIQQFKSELSENRDNITFAEFIRSKTYMKGLGISIVLTTAQQLSGIDAVLFYTEEIFQDAGVTELSPELCAIIIGLVVFASSFIAPFIVDRLGRKLLLITSLLGVCLSLAALGTYFYLKRTISLDESSISIMPILSLVAYIIMYNLGVGSVPWTVSSELFPTNVKSYALTVVTWACWTISFLITKFFNDLSSQIGEGQTFWIFGACSLVASMFTLFFVPETKGKSFQEIQDVLKRM